MPHPPLLLLHIAGGTVGVISGFITIALRKGSNRHRIAGYVFVASMLTMAGVGAYLAVRRAQPTNILGGTLTFYMVATAAMVFRRRVPATRIFDVSALLVALAVSLVEYTLAAQAIASPTGQRFGYPPPLFLIFGSIALLAAAGDLRYLLRSVSSRSQLLIRHLWRMCFGLFIAAGSIFLARPQLFPAIMRKSGALVFLTVFPFLVMLYWFVRVRRSASKGTAILAPRSRLSPSPTTV